MLSADGAGIRFCIVTTLLGRYPVEPAPGCRQSVAEMAIGMMIASARGIIQEHEAFRAGYEHWLADNPATDFSLYGQTIAFIGFGSIARELARLLAPFAPRILAHDPWLIKQDDAARGIELMTSTT